MRKTIIALTTVILANPANAQTSFSLEAGINSSIPVREGQTFEGLNRSSLTGFTAAAGVVTELKHSFRLYNKLGYTTKRFHETFFTGADYSGANNYRLSGLQYHLLFEKVLNNKKKLRFLPAAGLYSTFHLSGDLNYVYSTFGGVIKGSRKLRFGNNEDFSKWDVGFAASLGAEYKKISFRILSDFGLVNISSVNKGNWSTVHFTLGYTFR